MKIHFSLVFDQSGIFHSIFLSLFFSYAFFFRLIRILISPGCFRFVPLTLIVTCAAFTFAFSTPHKRFHMCFLLLLLYLIFYSRHAIRILFPAYYICCYIACEKSLFLYNHVANVRIILALVFLKLDIVQPFCIVCFA